MSKRGRPSNTNQTSQDRMYVPPKHWSAIRATISRQCKDNYRPEHRRPEWQRGAAEWLCYNQDHVWRVCDYSWATVQSDPREVNLRGDSCSTKNLAYFQGQNATPWRKSQNSWECSINWKVVTSVKQLGFKQSRLTLKPFHGLRRFHHPSIDREPCNELRGRIISIADILPPISLRFWSHWLGVCYGSRKLNPNEIVVTKRMVIAHLEAKEEPSI